MQKHNLISHLRAHLVDSLHFESDLEFRTQMARIVRRSVGMTGALGLVALFVFLTGQILFLGKTPVLSYVGGNAREITVVWDKLVMVIIFGCLLALRPFLPDDQPGQGRVAMAFAAIILVAAITMDDVALNNITFTPAYVTLVVLLFAAAVPMPPIMLFITTGLVVGAWYGTVTLIPGVVGFTRPPIDGEQLVFLSIIAIISTSASSSLYSIRHEEFRARKNVENLSRSLSETNVALEKAFQDLTAAQNRLVYSEKMASLGRFASGVAHELRNPLNFVSNFSKLSLDLIDEVEEESGNHPGSADLRENLNRISDHASRAERIVKSLVAHSERGSSHPVRVDINRLVTDQCSMCMQRYDSSRSGVAVNLTLQLSENVGELEVLSSELAQALDNVLDNAIQSTIERSLAGDSVYQPKINVATVRLNDRVRIEIKDNGIGIAEADSKKIFEPFYTTRPAGAGTGLGLASAYTVFTEAHGGSITFESEPGNGATFVIEIASVPGRAIAHD